MDKKNAEKGNKHERLFANSLKYEPETVQKLSSHFGITGNLVKTYPTGTAGGKVDVILKFSEMSLEANVKSFGKMGINQAARGSVGSFVRHCGLKDLEGVLSDAVVRKARKGRFILKEDEAKVSAILSPLADSIVRFALARNENPQLLVLYDNVKSSFYLYDLSEVLSEMRYDVSFSKPGNIMIGDHFLFHRKGGDGNSKVHDKHSPRHPGNDLAVKLLCKGFIEKIEPIVTYCPRKG